MKKKILLASIFLLVPFALIFSCVIGVFLSGQEHRINARTKQIISAINGGNRDALKSLFSKKALDEADDIDSKIDYVFEIMQGEIDSWKVESRGSIKSIRYGKKSWMIRFSITISTAKEDYVIFVIDYNVDTMNSDNQGVYMLEFSKSSYSGEWNYWQNRMCAGISIIDRGETPKSKHSEINAMNAEVIGTGAFQ